MRASVEVGASRKIGSRPRGLQGRGKVLAFLGRVVDDQHAIDPGVPGVGDKGFDAVALDRVGIAHQHHRRGRVVAAEAAHHGQHLAPA
jgi:hypothetical protein